MKRFKKLLKRIALTLLSLILIMTIVIFFYMRQDKFGKLPTGERLERIKKSPHYKDGRFRNYTEKPTLSEGYSIPGELYKTIFKKFPRREPEDSLPSVKTNLMQLSHDANVIVWFGHSSFFLQTDGVRFLADPVFSGSASPLPGSVKAFKGTDIYTVADIPEIDYLIISHDHYDHLDYKTIVALEPKVKHVICGLGVGAHFEFWGYPLEKIIEKDWHEEIAANNGIKIFTEPTHHDSGRGLKRAQSLWMSYLIQTPTRKIYYSGDGGYNNHFKEVGEKYGTIDMAIMECGQYNDAWQSVHKLPKEVVKATLDVNAIRMMPVHHSKFRLANHPWDEPLIKITEFSQHQPYSLITPMIGEVVNLDDSMQQFKKWWEKIN